jgi:hypothetical protein
VDGSDGVGRRAERRRYFFAKTFANQEERVYFWGRVRRNVRVLKTNGFMF